MIDVIDETFLFFDNSPKRERFFETILQSLGNESEKSEITRSLKDMLD